MTKFFKRSLIAVFVFIGLPFIIGLTLTIRKAIKSLPPTPKISQADSIRIRRDSIQAAAYAERNRPRNWYYRGEEDPMTSDTTFFATVDPKQDISVRTDREIVNVSVVETYDDNGYNKAYDNGYRNGYRNGKGKSSSIWGSRYSSSGSSSSGSTKKRTTVSSTNYADAYLTFTLQKNPGTNTDAYIKIAEGAFNPNYFNGQQKLHVRFDKDKADYFSTLGGKAHTGRILFITPTKKFLEKLKKAKTMLIEVEIVNNGSYVLEFDVHDLDWKHS